MTISFWTIAIENLSVLKILIVLGVSTFMGVILGLVYVFAHRKTVYDRQFSVTLTVMPLVVSIIIMLVSDNLARAFSLAGVFALVRFRTAIADSSDLTYILSSVGLGLAVSMGYIGYSIIILGFISIVLYLVSFMNQNRAFSNQAKLKIIVPEDLNYQNVFDEIFKTYLENYQLQRVKTTDFGTMFELTYLVRAKQGFDQKAFIDELRVRNGNLNITMTTNYLIQD